MTLAGRPPRTVCALPECSISIPPRPRGKTGPHPMYCGVDHRNRHYRITHLKGKYGITNDEYDKMLEKQGGVCAICGSEDPRSRGGQSFHVDHDHVTGNNRGLLCSLCNRMLGQALDNPDTLRAGAAYLEERNG